MSINTLVLDEKIGLVTQPRNNTCQRKGRLGGYGKLKFTQNWWQID